MLTRQDAGTRVLRPKATYMAAVSQDVLFFRGTMYESDVWCWETLEKSIPWAVDS